MQVISSRQWEKNHVLKTCSDIVLLGHKLLQQVIKTDYECMRPNSLCMMGP